MTKYRKLKKTKYNCRNPKLLDNEPVKYKVWNVELEPVLYTLIGEFSENELEEAKQFCIEQTKETDEPHAVFELTTRHDTSKEIFRAD